MTGMPVIASLKAVRVVVGVISNGNGAILFQFAIGIIIHDQ